MDSFDSLLVYMLIALLASTSMAFLLLCMSNNFCHPKTTLFHVTDSGDVILDSSKQTDKVKGGRNFLDRIVRGLYF